MLPVCVCRARPESGYLGAAPRPPLAVKPQRSLSPESGFLVGNSSITVMAKPWLPACHQLVAPTVLISGPGRGVLHVVTGELKLKGMLAAPLGPSPAPHQMYFLVQCQ